jgi:hypothetical protein
MSKRLRTIERLAGDLRRLRDAYRDSQGDGYTDGARDLLAALDDACERAGRELEAERERPANPDQVEAFLKGRNDAAGQARSPFAIG